MKRWIPSFFLRGAPFFGASAIAPLLVAYLYVGACGGGKSGVVVAFKGWGIAVTAAWCEVGSASGPPAQPIRD